MGCYNIFQTFRNFFTATDIGKESNTSCSNSAYLETPSRSRMQLFVTGQGMQCRKTSDFTTQRSNISLYIVDWIYPNSHSRVTYFLFHCYAKNSLINRTYVYYIRIC